MMSPMALFISRFVSVESLSNTALPPPISTSSMGGERIQCLTHSQLRWT